MGKPELSSGFVNSLGAKLKLNSDFQYRLLHISSRKSSAIISYFTEEAVPLLNDFFAAGLDDFYNITQSAFWNTGVVVAQITFSSASNPYLCGVGIRGPFTDMNVDRL